MTRHLSTDDSTSKRAVSRVLTDGGADDADAESTGEAATDEAATGDATTDDPDADVEFAERLAHARDLLTEDATACYVGVVRDGREVDSTFAQRADDAQQEGMQALSLLASHLRLVADEAGVDYETVAGDAVTLAERLDESP